MLLLLHVQMYHHFSCCVKRKFKEYFDTYLKRQTTPDNIKMRMTLPARTMPTRAPLDKSIQTRHFI
jgi:hypothetical protein